MTRIIRLEELDSSKEGPNDPFCGHLEVVLVLLMKMMMVVIDDLIWSLKYCGCTWFGKEGLEAFLPTHQMFLIGLKK